MNNLLIIAIVLLLFMTSQWAVVCGCGPGSGGVVESRRPPANRVRVMKVFERRPDVTDECSLAASGPCQTPVLRGTTRFDELIRYPDNSVRFHRSDSRIMSKRCAGFLRVLADRVWFHWKKKILVLRSWRDPESNSLTNFNPGVSRDLHCEGRALLIAATSNYPTLSAIGGIADRSGFDFVYYKTKRFLYLSVKPDDSDGAIYGGCISSEGRVTLRDNTTLPVGQLKGGEEVATSYHPNSNNIPEIHFNKFLGFFHQSAHERTLKIATSSGHSLRLTPDHLIYVITGADVITAVHASQLKRDDLVLVDVGQRRPVTSRVRNVTSWPRPEHVVAPYTLDGTIVVDGVVTSCFSYVSDDSLAYYVMFPLRWLRFPQDGGGGGDRMMAYMSTLLRLARTVLPDSYFHTGSSLTTFNDGGATNLD